MIPSHSSFRYRIHGLRVESYRDLPALELDAGPQKPDIENPDPDLRVTKASSEASFAKSLGHGNGQLSVHTGSGEVVLVWQGIGALRVRKGMEIQVVLTTPEFKEVMGYLIVGSGFGIALHQRQILSLHASAVHLQDSAVAFVGSKQMGKSTTAAAFAARGYPTVCDDVLAVRSKNDTFSVSPGERISKLWPSAVSVTRRSTSEPLPRLHSRTSKRVHKIKQPCPEHLPLRRIYLLDYCEDEGCDHRIEEVKNADAYFALTANTYALQFLGNEGVGEWHAHSLAQLVQTVPVRRLRRTPDLDRIGEVVTCVEQDVGLPSPHSP